MSQASTVVGVCPVAHRSRASGFADHAVGSGHSRELILELSMPVLLPLSDQAARDRSQGSRHAFRDGLACKTVTFLHIFLAADVRRKR